MPWMWFQTCTLISRNQSPRLSCGHSPISLSSPCLSTCICVCPSLFFSLRLFPWRTTSKPSRQAEQSPDALEKNANETVEQACSGFCGCIINSKERPLCPRAMFDNVLCGPWVRAGAALYRANLFSLYSLRITAPVSLVPLGSTSHWAMSWRPRRRMASTWLWCALTWSTRECSKAAG